MQDFRLLTAHIKFHQTYTLIDSFCWKYIKALLKKYRGVMSHYPGQWCKIWKKNWSVVSKMIRIWWVLTGVLNTLKNLHFHWFLLCKVFNVWPKKVERSYLSWHWTVMQSLKKSWLVVWKMTWGIWKIFTWAIESLKIGTLMGSLDPK